ncbi:Pro-kumamolisin [Diaporthe helianthi]|uniref:tripeptidyl-peptidase II n=1 Tax=Diaporthe helianthi TaxID=158607 RepID=A0A2P5HXB6_DIAHE|nr:Pro-kumamolisin [Diaporthe helianthi]
MKPLGIVLAAGLLASSAVGKPVRQRSPLAVKETHYVPRRWIETRRPDADHTISLRIGLKQGSFSDLERQLYEVSDPDHQSYGKHLKAEEVHKLVEPSEETLEQVHEWLADNGVDKSALRYSPARDWITVTLPVAVVEAMLDTKYSVYRHEDGSEVVRTPKWSLPLHLHDHIDTIQPTNSWYRAEPKSFSLYVETLEDQKPVTKLHSNGSVSDVCVWNHVTPRCLRTLYGTIDYQTQSNDTNIMGLVNYLGESNNRKDTFKFLSLYRHEAKSGAYDFKFDSIATGTTTQVHTDQSIRDRSGLEGNLDVQAMLGIGWPTKLIAYSVGNSPHYRPDAATTSNTIEDNLTWLEHLVSQPDDELAKVISTSYGVNEHSVPPSYARRICNDMAQLGARGVSLLFASGDYGVGPSRNCTSNDGTNRSSFSPMFPSSCPFVTSVGGTMNFTPEAGVVDAYVQSLGGRDAEFYNMSGRGYPDIAAQGFSYVEVWNSRPELMFGTSASAPAISAILALVNDALVAAGKSPLGFLNPWLYKRGHKAFTDITSGSAVGCSELGDGLGFPAQEGWDAVTGFGTPRFKDILELLGIDNASFSARRQA